MSLVSSVSLLHDCSYNGKDWLIHTFACGSKYYEDTIFMKLLGIKNTLVANILRLLMYLPELQHKEVGLNLQQGICWCSVVRRPFLDCW